MVLACVLGKTDFDCLHCIVINFRKILSIQIAWSCHSSGIFLRLYTSWLCHFMWDSRKTEWAWNTISAGFSWFPRLTRPSTLPKVYNSLDLVPQLYRLYLDPKDSISDAEACLGQKWARLELVGRLHYSLSSYSTKNVMKTTSACHVLPDTNS
jgi:hypothetical protein